MRGRTDFFLRASLLLKDSEMQISPEQIASQMREYASRSIKGNKVLAIIPDSTRSGGPIVGAAVKALAEEVNRRAGGHLVVMIALGTHGPMDHEAICKYLDLKAEDVRDITFVNHEWKDPKKNKTIHLLTRDEMLQLSGGRLDMNDIRLGRGVPVNINYRIRQAEDIVVIGPTLPHEVVGCSGGVKYFFPGCSGPEVTGVTHWLGATVTIPDIIGVKHTPVREVMNFLAEKIPVDGSPKLHCLSFVPRGKDVFGSFVGHPRETYEQAADLTLEVNVCWVDRKYDTVVALVSHKYDEMWVGGKGSYKLQTIVNPGGRLILVGPQINRVSDSWGEQIKAVGYHCLPYIQSRLGEYLDRKHSLGTLAHVTHVYGTGTWDGQVETPTIRVQLATALNPEACREVNLDFVDINSLDIEVLRKAPNTLVVDDAGEVLYRYRAPA
jgi:nickel-dependent lactate racemase